LNPGERLEDWFDADHEWMDHVVIGITATRLFSMPADRSDAKPISIDFARVKSVSETSLGQPLHAGVRLNLKTDDGLYEFFPRRNMKKVLSELQSRVKAASS
jgi:hypothetical protein